MKLKRRGRSLMENTGASSDIAFLLIIYFLVIAGFNVNRGFLMNLPAKNSAKVVLSDDLLRFELDGAGRLSFQGEEISRPRAERLIAGAAAAHPNMTVALAVAPRAPWQEVVSFVETVQKLKVDSFSFKMKEGTP